MIVIHTSKYQALLVTDSSKVQENGKSKKKDPKATNSKPKSNQQSSEGASGSKKKKLEKKLCPYIHSTLCLIYWKYPGHKEGPFMRWNKYTDDAVCVDEEIELDYLNKIPPVAMDEEGPPIESESYLA